MSVVRIIRTNEEAEKYGSANFINEIKHIREYAQQRYGVPIGLKEAKDAIESAYNNQRYLFAPTTVTHEMKEEIGSLIKRGNWTDLISLLKRMDLSR